jgi:hypothetical protein
MVHASPTKEILTKVIIFDAILRKYPICLLINSQEINDAVWSEVVNRYIYY